MFYLYIAAMFLYGVIYLSTHYVADNLHKAQVEFWMPTVRKWLAKPSGYVPHVNGSGISWRKGNKFVSREDVDKAFKVELRILRLVCLIGLGFCLIQMLTVIAQ